MDCLAEEQMVRMALDGVPGIQALSFDLAARTLLVWHDRDPGEVLAVLEPLALGATLDSTGPAVLPDTTTDEGESRTLRILLAINATMFVVELTAGWLARSTGLIADSLDMLADAAVYGVSLYAVGRSARAKTAAAHASGVVQVVLALATLAEVVRRAVVGGEPEAPTMMGIALLALVANAICLVLVFRHRRGGAHMRASYIFTASDVVANVGVILAGGLVAWTGSRVPDLVVGTAIAAVVLAGGMRILRLR